MEFEQLQMVVPPREELEETLVVPRGYARVGGRHVPLHPRGDYTTGARIMSALGSFWAEHFQSRGELLGLQRASCVEVMQSYVNYLEAAAATSRFDCPVFHRRAWYAIVLRESKLNTGRLSMLQYGGVAVYDGFYQYGDLIGNRFEEVGLDKLKSLSLITNRIVEPSVAWTRGPEFSVDAGALLLRDNPFEDGRFPVSNILDADGAVVDRETVLWAFDAREDWEFLYQHYGYAIRLRTASSESYKDLINALWNQLVGGPSSRDLEWALAALAGVPTVREAEETVEVILVYPDKTVIVTNKHGYIHPAGSVPRVAAGDRVFSRQTLVDTVQVFDLANFDDVVALLTSPRISDTGQPVTRYAVSPSSSSSGGVAAGSVYLGHRQPSKIKPNLLAGQVPLLEILPLTPALLGPGYEGSLGFRNEEGSFDVTNKRIHTVLGYEEDVDKFWVDADARGVADGATWLQLTGIPLPAYVNPAGWVIENFLRNNALVIYLRYSRFGENAVGVSVTQLLRDVMLPEKFLLYLLDVEVEESVMIPTDSTTSMTSSTTSGDNPSIVSSDPVYFYVNPCS